jgi:hypothetical protein
MYFVSLSRLHAQLYLSNRNTRSLIHSIHLLHQCHVALLQSILSNPFVSTRSQLYDPYNLCEILLLSSHLFASSQQAHHAITMWNCMFGICLSSSSSIITSRVLIPPYVVIIIIKSLLYYSSNITM